MKVQISVKNGRRIVACPYELPQVPRTAGQLLTMLAREGAAACNRRRKAAPTPLTPEAENAMAAIGKIGFGIPYSKEAADPEEAAAAALSAFADGLFRLWIDGREITQSDSALDIGEGAAITILRLVMLTGGLC